MTPCSLVGGYFAQKHTAFILWLQWVILSLWQYPRWCCTHCFDDSDMNWKTFQKWMIQN